MKRFLLVMIVMLTVSCSDKSSGSDGKNFVKDKIEYELLPSTHLVENPETEGLLELTADGTLIFADSSIEAPRLVKDHVIILGHSAITPNGLLRQIESVDKTEGNYIVKTRACPIQRAFKYLHISFKRPVAISDSQLKWNVEPGTVLTPKDEDSILRESGGQSFGPFSLDYYPFDGDNDHTTPEDQIHVTASMHGDIYYVFGINFDWPDWDEALTGDILPEISAGYYLSGEAGASLKAEGMAIKNFARTDTLAHADLGSFWIGPLYFTVSVDLVSQITGSAKSRFELSAGAEASFEIGAIYSTDEGGRLVPPSPEFTTQPVTAKATESANIKISVGPKVKLLLYDTLGPYASLNVFGDLSADSEREPSKCWQTKAGFEGGIGIELALFGETIADWGTDFDIWDKTLFEGTCIADPYTETPPDISDPAFTPWSLRITNSTGAWVYEDKLNLEQAIDGHWLISGNSLKVLSKISENGDVIFAKSFTSVEESTPVPMSITAAIPTSAITILALSTNPTGILALSNDGKLLWNRIADLSSESPRGLASVVETEDGYIVGGAILDENTLSNDAWIFKIDKTGTVIWSEKYGTAEATEWITSIISTTDGFLATGRSFSTSQEPAHQPFIIKFNSNGEVIWKKVITGCDTTESLTISKSLLSHDGDYILGGSFGTGSTKAVLIKIKPDGKLGWIYGFRNDTVSTLGLDVKDAVQLTDGGYLLSGTIWTAGTKDYLFAARTDAVGRPVWVKRISDNENDNSAAAALTGEGGAIIAGYSGHRNTESDTYSSIWLSRIGVKKGELTINSLADAVIDEQFEVLESPCVTVTGSNNEISDLPVEFTEKEVIEKTVSPVIEKL